MTHKLGVYWSVMHRRPQDYEYFKRLQPSVFKIMDGGPNDYQWARQNLPGSLVIARDWAMSEQHADMLKDPAGTGKRHAEEWRQHADRLGFDRAKTLVLGINEPRVWEPGVTEALRAYTIAMCDRATELGLRVGAMQLSVGWPNNTGPDTPPNWEPWHGVDTAIRANNGALILHEYWADNGPQENWGWWAGRSLKCPWQVPIIIGECGVDMYVKDGSVPHATRGWHGRMHATRYAAELAEYVGRMSADKRFVGCCVFASDFANREWWSFDIEPAYQAILATPIPDTKPTDTHLPIVIAPGKPIATVNVPDGANIRVGPGLNHAIRGAEPYGTQMQITGRDDTGQWWYVEMPHAEGWVSDTVVETHGTANVPVRDDVLETPEPEPVGDNWQRSREFVRRWEGGYQNNPADKGNWTGCAVGVGKNKGTKYGISACSYPELDIPSLKMDEADAIYERDYWTASGAALLPWPFCLLVFDTAVLHGVDTARKWLQEVGTDPYAFAAKRLRVYTELDNWQEFGAGWTNRVADLLLEASK